MAVLKLRGETVGERLTASKGRTTGWDYVRGILSISIIVFHSVLTSYGEQASHSLWMGPLRPLIMFILPAFFALSGFLVAGSLQRSSTIHEFLTLRAVRLIPALFFEVLISAMIVGPLLTALSLQDYFSGSEFRHYWLNIVGYIHYTLPGVFGSNPDPEMINRQLWTVPYELKCYLAITVIFLAGGTRRPWHMAAILAACMGASFGYDVLKGGDYFITDNVPPKALILSFMSGILIYQYKDRIRLDSRLFAICAVACWLLLPHRELSYFASLPVAMVVVYLGMMNPPRTYLSRAGDYSYGLYIYGYVIQQAYVFMFPDHRTWWMNSVFSLAAAFACAAISWHLVESPVLQHRKVAVRAVDRSVTFLAILVRGRRQGSVANSGS